MSVDILVGDVFAKLAELPDESVHCVVTSPPYWGLRDYGVAGQLGLEPTLGEHLETMVKVFEEVRRVMRPDATLWLNYGDCYAASPSGQKTGIDGRIRPGQGINAHTTFDDRTFTNKPFSTVQGVLKPKDLCMIPNRLAIALQEAGWWVRSEIVWTKPNPMPESVTDRSTSSHEKIWLLSKAQRYHYDADAVRRPYVRDWTPESNNPGWLQGKAKYVLGGVHKTGGFQKSSAEGKGANLRNVWNIATAPYAEAHFATFPPALAEQCIKAGCPENGIVLDCFGGAGTTGLVADRLGRNAILIELNPEYAELARKRIDRDAATRGDGPDEIMRGDDLPLFA